MRTMTIGILGRDKLTWIQLIASQKPVQIVACTDQLVVTRCFGEAFAGLTNAGESHRFLEYQRGRRVPLDRAAQEQAQPRCLRPLRRTAARDLFLGVCQRWVVRCDATVDDGDNDIFATQREIGPESPILILKTKKDSAVIGLNLLFGIQPDTRDRTALL